MTPTVMSGEAMARPGRQIPGIAVRAISPAAPFINFLRLIRGVFSETVSGVVPGTIRALLDLLFMVLFPPLGYDCDPVGVAVGHMAKIGGEVMASVVEPYSNKQHHGYLGNSYVGSWVNLGAGTSNSDLKNTYGEIRMEYDGDKIGTGSQFMGCVIGDYVKSAVNTSIFTGKIVGVCSMLYGFITMNVPGFVNYAQTLGYVTEVPLDVAVTAQQRVFRRRNVPHRPHDVELIHELFELTRAERETAAATLACYDLPL